jgi:hypothetical protein
MIWVFVLRHSFIVKFRKLNIRIEGFSNQRAYLSFQCLTYIQPHLKDRLQNFQRICFAKLLSDSWLFSSTRSDFYQYCLIVFHSVKNQNVILLQVLWGLLCNLVLWYFKYAKCELVTILNILPCYFKFQHINTQVTWYSNFLIIL